jgi:putative intracellular protease/amidase
MTPKRVLVICAKRYNGHELWTLLGILKQHGHKFEVVSQATLIKDELTLRPNTIKRVVYDVDPTEAHSYDAVCVVSGNMADTESYWTDTHVLDVIAKFRALDKPIAAICCSVPTLAHQCRGVRVSYFPLVRSRLRLERFGAILQSTSLTVDKNTITAENQMITQMWAEEIHRRLTNQPPRYSLTDSGYVPKGRPRRLDPRVQSMIDQAKR